MCGILGYSKKGHLPEEKWKNISILLNRGPDSNGVWQNSNVVLGHTRLAIIDISTEASQPMEWEDKYVIVFNGEIYNYIEIRNVLIDHGRCFKTSSDTEVLLAAYDYWGEKCVEHLNGMWAFAIYDKIKNIIFCSRDRFGEKPFYYYLDGERFVFASEIKAILPFMDSVRANIPAMIPFITRGFVNFGETTFFKDIYQLSPSHNLVFDVARFDVKKYRYYDIYQKTNQALSPSSDLLAILRDSICLRMRSDVRVGTCLSGGLDSSVVAALASQAYQSNKPFVAIHAKSSLPESDESGYAKTVSDYLGLELHMIEPSYTDFCDSLDDVFYTQDEPFGSTSIFMQYFVMKKARELGCKVMLDGQGADEVFLGYEHYLKYILADLKSANAISDAEFFENLKLFRYQQEWIADGASKINNIGDDVAAILEQGNIKFSDAYVDIFAGLLGYSDMFSFQKRELFSNNLPALLRYEDRDSMRFGVEARLPYLDYRIVEFALGLPTDVKFKNGYLKHLLRDAVSSSGILPQEIVWRYNKMGFESPQKIWLNKHKKEMEDTIGNSLIIREIFNKVDIRRDDFLWKLFSIAKWEKVFNVGL